VQGVFLGQDGGQQGEIEAFTDCGGLPGMEGGQQCGRGQNE